MNMQTAPGKFCFTSIFFITLLWPLACSSSDRAAAPTEWAQEPVETPSTSSPQAFAKLIDREMAVSEPHLRAHQGQIVLGQDQLQIVASSVPPLSGGSIFYPLLSAVYRATGKTWQQQTWQPQLEINISAVSGESLPLIGQDIELHNSQPQLISYFRSSNADLGQARLAMEWFGESPLLKISLTQQGGSTPLQWKLRMTTGFGEEHLIPLDQDHFAGMTISLFPEVFTVLSQTPLTIKTEKRQTILTAAATTTLNSTFVLLMDRLAVLQQPSLVAQLKQCRGDCLRPPIGGETWQVQLPWRRPLPKADKRLFQSLFVHDAKGGFVSTLPIFEGEQLKWDLPLDQKLQVLYPDNQGILQDLDFDEDTRSAQLPPLAMGSLAVHLKPGRPGFVEIRDAVRKSSVAWAKQLAHRPADILNAHSFLQKNWPLNAHLPAGDYQLQILDGMQRLCVQRFTILPGRHQVITCTSEDPKPELSLRANLSLDSSTSDEMLEAANFQAIGRLVRAGKEDPGNAQEIPMIMAEDQNLGLSLRAFPADEQMRKNWMAAKPKDNVALLPAFAKFAQQQDPPLQLLLECPDAGFQFEDYRWLALTLAPDIIEVFGCQQNLVEAFLQVAHKLQQKSSQPIKLAAGVPFWGLGLDSDFIPALYIPEPENLINALRNGEYSLGLRSEIVIPGPLPLRGALGPQAVMVRIRSYDLKNRGGWIRIHDQHGLLAEQALAPSREAEQNLRVPLRLRASSRFLRFELHADRKEDGLTQPFLLATSNFLGLNSPP